jgi:glycosyltransferase involved in cell wall biosynthesis
MRLLCSLRSHHSPKHDLHPIAAGLPSISGHLDAIPAPTPIDLGKLPVLTSLPDTQTLMQYKLSSVGLLMLPYVLHTFDVRWNAMRACIVSPHNTLLLRNGSGEYLAQFSSLLRLRGHECHLLILESHRPDQVRVDCPAISHYEKLFTSVRIRRAFRVSGRLYRTTLPVGGWPRRTGDGPEHSERGWLKDPDPRGLSWASYWIDRLGADVVVANYFNACGVFDGLRADVFRILLAHDLLSERLESFEAVGVPGALDASTVARERTALSLADLVLAIKPEDAQVIRTMPNIGQVQVLPPTAEPAALHPSTATGDVALFVGLGFDANVDALRWLITDVWPTVAACRPLARLRVVGTVATAYEGPWPDSVVRVGYVDSLENEYQKASVALVPTRVGSGVKIKAVEALSHGVPVVATPVGASGLEGVPPAVMRVANSPAAFARAITDVLSEPDRGALRDAAAAYVASHLSPGAISGLLEQWIEVGRDESRGIPHDQSPN